MTKKPKPRYIRLFWILGHIGPMAYHLALPLVKLEIHKVFHASQLRKFISYPFQSVELENYPQLFPSNF
jgi:hypothetical protein